MSRIVICTAQVPFVRGGNEALVDGLREALIAHGHSVDVVALPYSWSPKQNLLPTALAWRLLDLQSANGQPIDQIICTKFPSYAARHPRKVVWLVHQHRQAYDWYGTPYSDFVNSGDDRALRESIMQLDRHALGEARRRFAISRNVARRLKHYNDLDAHPLYPPSRIAPLLRAGPYGDFLLSVSRLDSAKRIDLFLQALACTREAVPARIVGEGPERERLQRLAGQLGLSQRVSFLGRVPDAQLLELFAEARAVYYAPVDEDYGFASVEALAAARPVLTTHDSGGVLEFVVDGSSGLVCEPAAQALAARIDLLIQDQALARRLGQSGPALVRDITWQRVVQALVL